MCLPLAHLKTLTENCFMLMTTGLATFSSRRKNRLFHSYAAEPSESFTPTDSALAGRAHVKHATHYPVCRGGSWGPRAACCHRSCEPRMAVSRQDADPGSRGVVCVWGGPSSPVKSCQFLIQGHSAETRGHSRLGPRPLHARTHFCRDTLLSCFALLASVRVRAAVLG